MIWLLLTIILAGLIYLFIFKRYRYWLNKGIQQKNLVSFLADQFNTIFKTKSLADIFQDVYQMSEGKRYMGFHHLLMPTLLLKDPELIKQLCVKEFDYFMDHRSFVPDDVDPLWGKNLLSLKGNKWREMRATLSPSFTSSKMKIFFNLMSECSKSLTSFYKENEQERMSVEMKNVFSRFANDVIASTAFGVNCDSFREKNNEFYIMGKEIAELSSLGKNFIVLLSMLFPKITKLLGFRFLSKKAGSFFTTLIRETIRIREEQNIKRLDMIHLLMEARKGRIKHDEIVEEIESFAVVKESKVDNFKTTSNVELTDVDITAQALIFFLGGFDTVSNMMSFMAYELARNLDIQDRLQEEIDDTMKKCNGKLTYELLMKMKYLDMVVSETLRLWPSFVGVDRVCVKPYIIQPTTPDEKPVQLDVGDAFVLPIYPLHRDPQNFPNPDRFDPERFSEENKYNIKPYSYIPFGAGPRSCIASRFVLMEAKTIFFHLLSKFNIVVTEKTEIPVKLNKKHFGLTPQNGIWLRFNLRSDK